MQMQVAAKCISRRSKNMQGVRYAKRGVDNIGNAANFVETEQLLLTQNETHSFAKNTW